MGLFKKAGPSAAIEKEIGKARARATAIENQLVVARAEHARLATKRRDQLIAGEAGDDGKLETEVAQAHGLLLALEDARAHLASEIVELQRVAADTRTAEEREATAREFEANISELQAGQNELDRAVAVLIKSAARVAKAIPTDLVKQHYGRDVVQVATSALVVQAIQKADPSLVKPWNAGGGDGASIFAAWIENATIVAVKSKVAKPMLSGLLDLIAAEIIKLRTPPPAASAEPTSKSTKVSARDAAGG